MGARRQHWQVLAHGRRAMAQGLQLEQRGAHRVGHHRPGRQPPVQRDALARQHAGQQFVVEHAVGHQGVAGRHCLLQCGQAEDDRQAWAGSGGVRRRLQAPAAGPLQQLALGAAQLVVWHRCRAALVLQALHAAVEPVQAVAQRRRVGVGGAVRRVRLVIVQGAGAEALQLPQHLRAVAAGQRPAQLLQVGAQVVGEEGTADLVAGQGAAARFEVCDGGLEVAAGGLRLTKCQCRQAQAGQAALLHRPLLQALVSGQRSLETAAGLGVLAGQPLRFLVEVAGGGQGVGQADVGQHRMGMVAQAGKQHGCFAVLAGRVGIGIAAKLQRPQVLADAGGRAQIAQGQQVALGGHCAIGGLRMLAQHRQGHDLGHLGLGRRVGLADAAQAGGGAVEQPHRVGHLPADHRRQAAGPVGQGGNLGPQRCRHIGRQQRPQGLGRAHCPGRLGAPGLVAQGLERPGQGQWLVGRVSACRCAAGQQAARAAERGLRA